MRVLLLGVERRSGKAKATGRPFDFTQVNAAVAVSPTAGDSFSLDGFGFTPIQIRADNGIEKLFDGLSLPGMFDLEMQTEIDRSGEVSAKMVGLKAAK